MEDGAAIPPQNGEGDHAQHGGGVPRQPKVLRAPIKHVKQARKLRSEMSLPEVLLWQELRKRPGGFRFRRQNPQGAYKLDFCCLSARLAVEIDGEAHNRGDQPNHDAIRDAAMDRRGFQTLRIPAIEVLQDLNSVITGIVALCRERGPLHRPSDGPPPRSGEE